MDRYRSLFTGPFVIGTDRGVSRREYVARFASLLAAGGIAWPAALVDAKKKRRKRKKRRRRSGSGTGSGGGSSGGGSAGLTICAVPYTPDGEEQAVLGLINAHRGSNGVAPLALQCQLGAAAERHAQNMAATNTMYHNPDVRAYQLGFGYAATSWAENIASGQATANQVFTDWKNSPTHNQNMLSASFTEIGIGRAASPTTGTWYWSTQFGRR